VVQVGEIMQMRNGFVSFVSLICLCGILHCKQKINSNDQPVQEATAFPTQREIPADQPKSTATPYVTPVQVYTIAAKKQYKMYNAKVTLYTTESTAEEGGPKDRKGSLLNSVKSAVSNGKPVSVSMDANAFPYGTILRIPEVEKFLQSHFNKPESFPFKFKVVDTGGNFTNKGKTRMDICVGASQSDVRELSKISLQSFDYYAESEN
jgi:hypothetical protein